MSQARIAALVAACATPTKHACPTTNRSAVMVVIVSGIVPARYGLLKSHNWLHADTCTNTR
jgi:hypothetical protein